jgi:pilus assembly protein Flp/PilA
MGCVASWRIPASGDLVRSVLVQMTTLARHRKEATMIRRFFADENGVTTVEYGLIGGFILLAIVATIAQIGPQLLVPFEKVDKGIAAAIGLGG